MRGFLDQRRRCLLVRSATDADAFSEFYDAYVDRVIIFFTRRTLDAEIASDLTAETFAVALDRRLQFRGTTSEEEQGWLFAIARSQLSHFWRRGEVERNALTRLALEPPTLAEGDIERIEAMAELDDLRRDIARALSGISEEQAYCVRQRVLAERSYSELAAELGVTEQVVRARVSRGLRAMAQSLGGDEELEEVA